MEESHQEADNISLQTNDSEKEIEFQPTFGEDIIKLKYDSYFKVFIV